MTTPLISMILPTVVVIGLLQVAVLRGYAAENGDGQSSRAPAPDASDGDAAARALLAVDHRAHQVELVVDRLVVGAAGGRLPSGTRRTFDVGRRRERDQPHR